jgi:hypothetical protein
MTSLTPDPEPHVAVDILDERFRANETGTT